MKQSTGGNIFKHYKGTEKINKIVVEHLGEIFQIEKINWKNKSVEVNNGDSFYFHSVTFLKPIPNKDLKKELIIEAI